MSVVMGTAGHIDHGKTSLVKRLSSVDCDRLAEEKRRGITIELGFAPLVLPSGQILSVVDVPGHERFVRTMVAGAFGVDCIMLVVAADEGVMPQTREHLEICSFLGIKTGLIALTKIDTVDAEMATLAEEDVREFLKGTFLENAPIFSVSSATGEGIEVLLNALSAMEAQLAKKERAGLFRLPVDRVFTMRGHGTVVTGTMIAGSLAVGDDVMVYPEGISSKVRSVQNHGTLCDVAMAGRRTAINLQGVDVESINRGDVLAKPGTLFPSQRWIMYLTCSSSAPLALRHRTEVHLHHCACEMQARLYFFDRDRLEPGDSAICEVRFSKPYAAVFGDRSIIRSYSPLRTVAGGVVVHATGVAMRRRSPFFGHHCEVLGSLVHDFLALDAKEASTDVIEENRVVAMVTLVDVAGVSFSELEALTGITGRRLLALLGLLSGRHLVFCYDREEKRYLSASCLERIEKDCLDSVAAFHAANAMKQGIGRSALASGWGKKLHPKIVHMVIERLVKSVRLDISGDVVYLPGHVVALASGQNKLRQEILAAHKALGIAPPNMKDVIEALGANPKEASALVKVMQDAGELVKVSDAIWYEAEALQRITSMVLSWFKSHDNLDLAGLKELTALSRKYLVVLLEYYDREKVTVRVGDKRVLR